MYVEFVVIFVLLGVLAVLVLASIVLQILTLKKIGNASGASYPRNNFALKTSGGSGIVFCPNCGKQYDGKHNICPSCGAFRK